MCFKETELYVTERQYLDSRSIFIIGDTFITVTERPEYLTGDGIPNIGYVKGAYESGFRYCILLMEENPHLNESVPVPNGTVTLTITLWDDRGGRYINTTTRKTNVRGRADFNFTEFRSNEGVSIAEWRLGASGKVYFEFRGSNCLTGSGYEEEVTYRGRPFDPYDDYDGNGYIDPCFCFMFCGGSIFYVVFVIIIGLTLRGKRPAPTVHQRED